MEEEEKNTNQNEEKKTSVFLIDDDAFLLDMYAVKFKTSGFKVEIAYGAKEALEKLKKGFHPDVVLLDIVMPRIDGFEFLEILKKEKLLKDSMVIILSNLGQKEDVDKGKSLGAVDYIVKASFTPTEVVEKVKALLKAKGLKS